MNTLELLISPFIFIIKQIFLFSYDITNNYGLSIIILSFAISLLLLPIFIFIEKAKKRDDIIKLKMKPLVDEIKRCYKSQERYYYLKTLNRQFNYSPLRALIPILSLLLQIPFFIAAYQFIEGFEPLSKVSFIFIKDLSEPDALFGAVNILPIAMTLVNLLTAYFYTRNGDASERRQMLIVAGVFLVLLFNLPSGLVLYWTMNNVFSFFRLFITNKEVFKKRQTRSLNSSISKLNIFEISIKPSIFYSLVFLSIYFHLAAKFYFTGENLDLNYLSLIVLIPTQFIGILHVLKMRNRTNRVLFYLTLTVLFIALSGQLLNFLVFPNSNYTSNFITLGLIFILFTIPFYFAYTNKITNKPIKTSWPIYTLSVLYITGLIFFWHPLQIFSSHPEVFDFPAIEVLRTNLRLFLTYFIYPIAIYIILPKKLKRVLLLVVITIVVISFIYSSVIPINLGNLQESRFSEQEKLASQTIYYILEAILLIVVFIGVKLIYYKQNKKIIIGALVVLNVFLIGNSLYNTIQTGFFFKTDKDVTTEITSGFKEAEISFSKNRQNIVYYMVDGAQGWFMNEMMKDSELKKTFEGFTWYPNTISMSNYTHSSVPSMMCGETYSVPNINNDTENTIEYTVTKASEEFFDRIKSNGYTFTSTYMHHSKIDKTKFDSYIPGWSSSWKRWSSELNLGALGEIWHTRLWENALFYSVPLFLKPKIYNNKEWLSTYRDKGLTPASFKKYNFVRLLPYISNTDAIKSNFIYIHGQAAHNPWNIVDDNGRFIKDVTPYQNNKWIIERLGKWINWMKDNSVYDNTKIIIVSDHGADWGGYDGKMDMKSPVKWDTDDPKKISKKRYWRLNPLLMVKDFNSNEPYKEDWRLMSNADTPAIIFDDNDPTKADSVSRSLHTYWTFWHSEMVDQKTMEVFKHFEIKDNVFDLRNWKKRDK